MSNSKGKARGVVDAILDMIEIYVGDDRVEELRNKRRIGDEYDKTELLLLNSLKDIVQWAADAGALRGSTEAENSYETEIISLRDRVASLEARVRSWG